MINYLLLPVTFLSSFLGTWLFIRLGNSQQWLDQPNSRSSHSNPTPTSGGVAFVLVFLIASLLAFRTSSPGFNVVLVLSLCACVAALGLADDIIKLGIGTRIMTQLLVIAGVLAIFGVPAIPLFGNYLEPEWGGYMLLALVLLWFINLFNFMDGLDGIAASQVIFICLSVFMITWNNGNAEYHTLLLLLVASVVGIRTSDNSVASYAGAHCHDTGDILVILTPIGIIERGAGEIFIFAYEINNIGNVAIGMEII